MNFEIQRIIPADHPSLEGHFPGHPVVPGVVILDEVASALARNDRACLLKGIPVVKFLAPLEGGQVFTLSFIASDERRVKFQCTRQGRTLVQGELEVIYP